MRNERISSHWLLKASQKFSAYSGSQLRFSAFRIRMVGAGSLMGSHDPPVGTPQPGSGKNEPKRSEEEIRRLLLGGMSTVVAEGFVGIATAVVELLEELDVLESHCLQAGTGDPEHENEGVAESEDDDPEQKADNA